MILEILVDIFFGLLDLILSLIPNITVPSGFLSGISQLASVFGYIDTFVPISTLVACLTLITIVDNAGFIIKLFNFIIRKIPGLS